MDSQSSGVDVQLPRALGIRIFSGILWSIFFGVALTVVGGLIGLLNSPAECLSIMTSPDADRTKAEACAQLAVRPTEGFFVPVVALAIILSVMGKLPGTGRFKKKRP